MHFKWNYAPPTPEHKEAVRILAGKLGVSPVIASLLIRRGITTESAAKRFFRPSLGELLDPFLMDDMDVAVDRLNDAMGRKERIMIFGDYDVDGCSAVALVYRFLRQFYSNIVYYIPDRYDEGYGASFKGITAARDMGVRLLIVLDCGIKAVEEIAFAKTVGIDVIVCDHHLADDVMPPATAILNPKRPDSNYPFKHLCGCGVGFKFMQAFAANNGIAFTRLVPLLELCAMSIASDIVPVTGENRVLAWHGLRQLNSQPSVGLKALIRSCGLQGREITMSDIMFKLGPRINAPGRMENGKDAVAILVQDNRDIAEREADLLNKYNEQRKDADRHVTEEADKIMNTIGVQSGHKAAVLYDPDWKKGVVGIVASRITETYYRPTVVLTQSGEMVSGSGRSIAGFDIYAAVNACRDLLESFGGHTYAVGLTLRKENVPLFRKRFLEYVDANLDVTTLESTLNIEEQIDFRDITKKFLGELKRLAPHGPCNVKPLFITRKVYDYGTSRVVGRRQEHIKLELVDSRSGAVLSGIAFGQSSAARYIKSRRSFDIVYSIEENIFRRGTPSLQIEDIRPTDGEE